MIQQVLTTGTISVQVSRSDFSAEALFDFAERRNPKRSFLFVSKVLGRHIPVKPSLMRDTYQRLASQLPADADAPFLFVGMAETAVGLAAGVFEEALDNFPNSVLLTTTRHPVKGKLLCEFKEEHSHATDHLVYWPANEIGIERVKNAKTLVLVDDEATTGNTFKNLTQALLASGLSNIQRIITITLTDWSENALQANLDLPVTPISLMEGAWQWQPRPDATLPDMPHVNVTQSGAATVSPTQDWGRLGVTEKVRPAVLQNFSVQPAESILVIGSGEFVYIPFLLAEHLEQLGGKVLFGTTSRSPIADGLAIESSLAFADNYGLGIPNYCYNVAHQQFDRIIICTETAASHLDPALLTALGQSAPQVEVFVYA